MERLRIYKLIGGPLTGLVIYFILRFNGTAHAMAATGLIISWVALWWITEPHDFGITSLLPVILFPLLGIMSASQTAMLYMEQTIFLFIGGFFLAYAVEKHKLHQRLAFSLILLAGSKPSKILAGIMTGTFFISMWISNTATTMMLFAAVLSIFKHENLFNKSAHKKIATAYLLGLAYSASIGGVATIVGTPTNTIFAGLYEKLNPEDTITFFEWTRMALPFALTFGIAGYFILKLLFIPPQYNLPFDVAYIKNELKAMGRPSHDEKKVLIVFVITVVLWFTRSDINFGAATLKGWTNLLPDGALIKDSTIAVFAALLLFIIPASEGKNAAILEWSDIKKLPLNIVLLFGSGFAIAEGFASSGLAGLLAGKLTILNDLPLWIIIAGVACFVTLLSEFASNVASIQLVIPLLIPLCISINVEPKLLMIPATVAASFGFMMPIATAPNTIVYATGEIDIKQMLRTGMLFNVTGIILLTLYMLFFI